MAKKKRRDWIKVAVVAVVAIAGAVGDFEAGEVYYDRHNVCFTPEEMLAIKRQLKHERSSVGELDPEKACDEVCKEYDDKGSFNAGSGVCTCSGRGT